MWWCAAAVGYICIYIYVYVPSFGSNGVPDWCGGGSSIETFLSSRTLGPTRLTFARCPGPLLTGINCCCLLSITISPMGGTLLQVCVSVTLGIVPHPRLAIITVLGFPAVPIATLYYTVHIRRLLQHCTPPKKKKKKKKKRGEKKTYHKHSSEEVPASHSVPGWMGDY